VAISPLAKGQTILETLLASVGSGSGLQALIPPGMRAVTLEVNEFSSVGGMLEPGCHVDLIANLNDPKTHEAVCRTILQNVKITAIGRSVTPPHPAEGQPLPPPSNSITLLLAPKQVQTLQLAAMTGRPWFALRSGRDDKEINIPAMPIAELRGNEKESTDENAQAPVATAPVTNAGPFTPVTEVAPEQPKTERHTVTIIRGGVETRQVFVVPVVPAPQPEPGSTVDTDNAPVFPGTK
jgi:pilus assembly protein CpaB